MSRRPSRLAPLALAALLAVPLASVAAPAAADDPAPGQPGALNAITDVPGLAVGQVQSDTAPYLTGTTVVHALEMSVAGVDQRGGAPATRETDLLSPLNSNPGVNAVQLGGSSMYGLDAAGGIVRWLEDRGEGVPIGVGVAPIVPGADIFDLGRGGDVKARTSAEWGWLAAEATDPGAVRQGAVGGGTGARAGGLKGGVGTASVHLGDGIYVGALVVVNSVGSTVDPSDCSLRGAAYGLGDEFAGYAAPSAAECAAAAAAVAPDDSLNTTIAVVATNLPLEKAAAQRMSGSAHDGLARAIDPIHTLSDGDTVFAISTGDGEALQNNDPADSRQLNGVYSAAAQTLSRAVARAMLSAESVGGIQSYCDRYPSACAGMTQLDSWRTAGEAPDVTPRTIREAGTHLGLTRVPWPGRPTVPGQAPAVEEPAVAPEVVEPSSEESSELDGLALASSGGGSGPSARDAVWIGLGGGLVLVGLAQLTRQRLRRTP